MKKCRFNLVAANIALLLPELHRRSDYEYDNAYETVCKRR
jgi:hypothetical protein